jgi:hypothetical protein
MSDLRTCKWHGCGGKFSPQHGSQEYCCTAHRVKMMEWRKMRGSTLVSLLLETPPSKVSAVMKAERKKLLDEMGRDG